MDETQNEVALQLERLASAIKQGDYLVQSYALEQLITPVDAPMYGEANPNAPAWWASPSPTGEVIFTLKVRRAQQQ